MFENKRYKRNERFMIISSTKIDYNTCIIRFAFEKSTLNYAYKGLFVYELKTNDFYIYNYFNDYGRWLKRKNKYVLLLLHLLNKQKKISL